MATEIELKAHVMDSEALKRALMEKAEYLWAFEKEDSYWIQEEGPGRKNRSRDGDGPGPEGGDSGSGAARLRLRREKRFPPGGTEETACFATWKNKTVIDGIETNDEREFEIRAPSGQGGAEFEEFLKRAGFSPDSFKRKRGWAFSREGIAAELTELDGLGWFIELEILAEAGPANKAREEILAREKKRLLDFLAGIGIGKEAIESRFYSAMLKERAGGN